MIRLTYDHSIPSTSADIKQACVEGIKAGKSLRKIIGELNKSENNNMKLTKKAEEYLNEIMRLSVDYPKELRMFKSRKSIVQHSLFQLMYKLAEEERKKNFTKAFSVKTVFGIEDMINFANIVMIAGDMVTIKDVMDYANEKVEQEANNPTFSEGKKNKKTELDDLDKHFEETEKEVKAQDKPNAISGENVYRSLPLSEEAYKVVKEFLSELSIAIKKHPNWPENNLMHQMCIVNEEAGETTRAVLQYIEGEVLATSGSGYIEQKEKWDHIKRELAQTGAMCMRMMINMGEVGLVSDKTGVK